PGLLTRVDQFSQPDARQCRIKLVSAGLTVRQRKVQSAVTNVESGGSHTDALTVDYAHQTLAAPKDIPGPVVAMSKVVRLHTRVAPRAEDCLNRSCCFAAGPESPRTGLELFEGRHPKLPHIRLP